MLDTKMRTGEATAGAPPAGVAAAAVAARTGYVRWGVCALLFFAATINYVDRQVIGILKPTLQQQFGWSEIDYADIVFAFQLAYAIGLLLAGRVMDRVGTRLGFAVAIIIWSVAAMAHAEALAIGPAAAAFLGIVGLTYAPSVAGFIAARFALGIGEAGNFPAAIKTVAEWFPKRERALATGIFNGGTNIGAVVTPLVVPWITLTYGWYWAFVVTGALGFLWLFAWWFFYDAPERHRRVSRAELDLIKSDPPEPAVNVPWLSLLPHRQTWAFAVAKFMTDPIWWVYLFWVPDFLNRNHGVNLASVGLPLIIIYLVADVGSIAGGWLSSSLIKRGWSVNRARKTTMLISALAVVPMVFAAQASNMWTAVALISLAASAHQAWSCNVFTLTSDMFPRQAVGSVVGFGGMAGAVGGMLIAKLTGALLEFTGSYVPVFLIAGSTYLAALAIVHLLVPRLEPVKLD
jgi:MFS transporter, ACS family, aldohexuronate transporter